MAGQDSLQIGNPLLEGLVRGEVTAVYLFAIVIFGVMAAEVIKILRGKPFTRIFSKEPGSHPGLRTAVDVFVILFCGPLLAVLLVAPVNSKECLIAGLSWIALVQSAAKD
jgi:hypothetical protein